jgi:hypothetical protein
MRLARLRRLWRLRMLRTLGTVPHLLDRAGNWLLTGLGFAAALWA